jgi:transposase
MAQALINGLKWLAILVLPPYLPDFKPIERIWLVMKANSFNNYVCKNVDKVIERLDQAIFDVIDDPERTKITTSLRH